MSEHSLHYEDAISQCFSGINSAASGSMGSRAFFTSTEGQLAEQILGRRHAHHAYDNAVWIDRVRHAESFCQNGDSLLPDNFTAVELSDLRVSLSRQMTGKRFQQATMYAIASLPLLGQLALAIGCGTGAFIDAGANAFFDNSIQQAARVHQDIGLAAGASAAFAGGAVVTHMLDRWFHRPAMDMYARQLEQVEMMARKRELREGLLKDISIFLGQFKKEELDGRVQNAASEVWGNINRYKTANYPGVNDSDIAEILGVKLRDDGIEFDERSLMYIVVALWSLQVKFPEQCDALLNGIDAVYFPQFQQPEPQVV